MYHHLKPLHLIHILKIIYLINKFELNNLTIRTKNNKNVIPRYLCSLRDDIIDDKIIKKLIVPCNNKNYEPSNIQIKDDKFYHSFWLIILAIMKNNKIDVSKHKNISISEIEKKIELFKNTFEYNNSNLPNKVYNFIVDYLKKN